jgi:branched-chain amino acid aminotransferase
MPSDTTTPPDRRIWIDGQLVPWQQATVHVLSHSLQRGSLIFDYMSVHDAPRGAAIFRLREHLQRFLRSAQLVGLPIERELEQLEAACCEAVRANPGAKSLKISAYIPSIEVDVVPQDPRVRIAVAAYDPWQDVIRRNPGEFPLHETLSVWIEKERRNRRPDIMPPQAKVAANYTSPMAAKWAARRAGYDEILLVDDDGYVAEGPTSNVFFVDAQGTVRTPPEKTVLLGITRLSVLEIAKHDGLPAEPTPVRPEELMAASEVFLTGTTVGVWPVTKIDDRPVGTGRPGPVTLRLRKRFAEVSGGQDPDFAHWLTPVSDA